MGVRAHPRDDLGLALLAPLGHFGVDLLAHLRLDLTCVTWIWGSGGSGAVWGGILGGLWGVEGILGAVMKRVGVV